MDDEMILALYWQRNESAITASAEKYGGYCGTIAGQLLQNRQDAEEVLNDTWLGAWNAIPPHRPSILRTFLGRITRNLAFSRYRENNAKKRGGGEKQLVLEELKEVLPAQRLPEEELESKELGRLLTGFLQRLPQRERNVFIRRYWYAESSEQIGKRFNMKPSAVLVSLSRTRKKLRMFLEREGIAI